jgi:glycosyltransferase involved in cell wall biosynthesis
MLAPADISSGGTNGRAAARLERSRWHKPLVSIVITHHNNSHFLQDALLSVLDQTYEHWECVVVDDASTEAPHLAAAQAIVGELGSPKVRFLKLPANVGQIHAFYAGIAITRGEFVCIIDPDDRYAATFLEEMIRAHLNEVVMCPIASCQQYYMKNGGIISGVCVWQNTRFIEAGNRIPDRVEHGLFYTNAAESGWHWASGSAMMLRRSALKLTRPRRPLSTTATDAYIAQGLHRLGGTLFLTKPLVYRGLHDDNSYVNQDLFSTLQDTARPLRKNEASDALADVLHAIKANGGDAYLQPQRQPGQRRSTLSRWKRSFDKRWKKVSGRVAR